MSRARIVMEKQHEILRLKLDCGLSVRRIAEALDNQCRRGPQGGQGSRRAGASAAA